MTQHVDITLAKAWEFFSKPENLSLLTPDDMNFTILEKPSVSMYEGMLIRYKVSPIKGIKLGWTSEITKIKPREYFIDKQLEGPFKYWHHEHHFKETPNGVELRDVLYYRVPFGIFGKILHKPLVRKKLNAIFAYRQNKIAAMFKKIQT